MAVKKIEMRPKGDGSYGDILYPKTSGDMVIMNDGKSVEQKVNEHLADGASDEVRPHGMGTAAGKDAQVSTTDETAERLMRVGAFGLGGVGVSIPDSDCNKVEACGFYSLTASTINAFPGKLSGDSLLHISYNDGYALQIGGARSNTMWMRYCANGTWGDWQEVFHEGNQPKLRINSDIVEYLDGNTWKPISKGGLLPGFNGLLYYSGEEYIQFDVGYKTGTATQSKNADYLLLQPSSTTGECTYVTGVAVDLTNVNTLKVDWEQSYADNNTYLYLIASTSKMGNYEIYDARAYVRGQFSRKIDTLDVSNLTGMYYVRVAARRIDAYSSSSPSHKIYRIWGE